MYLNVVKTMHKNPTAPSPFAKRSCLEAEVAEQANHTIQMTISPLLPEISLSHRCLHLGTPPRQPGLWDNCRALGSAWD